jgi:hypothetical protein
LLNEINKNKECFLVDNNWMESYKKIFSYEKLIHQILKILKESKEIEKDKDKIEKIYEKLDNKYMDEINEKVKNHEETGNKECKKFAGFIDRLCGEKFYESSNIEGIIKYNNFKFNIFSENILSSTWDKEGVEVSCIIIRYIILLNIVNLQKR